MNHMNNFDLTILATVKFSGGFRERERERIVSF